MPRTYLISSGHRLAYKCIQQYCVPYFNKNIIQPTNAYSILQYCTLMNGENIYLTKRNINKASNDVHDKEIINKIPFNKSRKDILTSKKLEQLYQEPKNSLLTIYRIVCKELNDQSILTSSCDKDHKSLLWEFTYHIKWPETMSFKAVNSRKVVANKIAALKCLEWLQAKDKLKNGKPILYDKKQIKDMQTKICELSVAPEILDNMENLIETYKMKIDILRVDDPHFYSCNIRTVKPDYKAFGPSDKSVSNYKLRNRILQTRSAERCALNVDLPIIKFRNEILSMLEKHRILLIEGNTGCGKSTQVPQFILDSYERNGNATDCNILVSEPRRIAAMSLADRIAHERGEIVGDVVGYQVRLENVTPSESGRILYCTTGILLRKLQCNPDLEGCSHVILDEAHERTIDIDLLMFLLKRALDLNPDLKLVIMSATINSHIFQVYFDCPIFTVPGKLYSVEMNFLDDIENLPNINKYSPDMLWDNREINKHVSVLVDFVKVVQVIKWIATNKPHGAILCFLPGWSEICQIRRMLEDEPISIQKQLVLSIHSKETYDKQRRIFETVPKDTRKIILATNIAETGITIPDVCYVVDTAIHKTIQWDDTKDVIRLTSEWITKANIHQRKGRAGRIRPGVSYHLIKRAEYDKLMEYPIASILSRPLEKTILECKLYSDEKAEIFFNGLIEPPPPSKTQKGVDYLVRLGVLDKEENLTALGKRMVTFTTHPKVSKALVYSAIFNCTSPILTIANIFSNEDDGFSNVLENKARNRENKKTFHSSSDHIAMLGLFHTWYTYNHKRLRSAIKFCQKMNLRYKKMRLLAKSQNLLFQQMKTSRLLNDTSPTKSQDEDPTFLDYDIATNKYEDRNSLVQAILYSATQQLIEHKDAGFKNGLMRTGLNQLRVDKFKAMITGDSVNYKRTVWPSSYLTYINDEHCDMRKRMIIRETSIISPLTVLLFNQRKIEHHELDDKTKIKVDVRKNHTLNFSCDKRTADVLLKFRDIMWSVVQYSLEKQGIENSNYGSRLMSEYKNQLLETLVKALDESSKCIEDTKDDNDDNNNDNNDNNNDNYDNDDYYNDNYDNDGNDNYDNDNYDDNKNRL